MEENVIPKDEKAKAEYDLKFHNDNKGCKGMLLHHMSNALLNIYMKHEFVRDIWDALNKKYSGDDVGSKHLAISRWLNFKIKGDKSIIDWIHEYENLYSSVAPK